MEAIGTRLRKTREKKRLSLEEAQKALKIHPSILKALEEDSAHKFLSLVYVRSFLRSYARYLGLDAEKIVEQYLERHSEQPEQILFFGREKRKIEQIKKYLPLAGKIIVAILVFVIIIVFARGVFRFARLIVAKKSYRIESTKKVKLSSPAPSRPAINIPKSEPLTLAVKANDDVWIEIKSDGEVIFRNVLSKGSRETWKAKKKIELWTGKADVLELTLNGNPLGFLGKGVRKGILITHKGMQLP